MRPPSHPPGFAVAACSAIAMVSLTLGTVGPLLPRLEASMHSAAFAALVVAGHPVGSFLAAVPTLLASRRFGLPRTIAAGAAIAFAGSVLFVFPGGGWWIVLARVAYGAGATTVWQSVFAWAIGNSGPSHRARTIALLTAASTAGALAAPQLGALASAYGVWLCALPPLLLLAAASRFAALPGRPELEPVALERVGRALRSRDGLGGAALTASAAVFALGIAVSLPLVLHRHGVPAAGIGAVQTLAWASLVLIAPFAGKVADLGHTRALAVAVFSLLAFALLGLATASSAGAAVAVGFACASLGGISGFAGSVLTSRAVDRAGLAQTVSQTINTLVWAPCAALGSVAAGALPSPEAALVVLAGATALAALVAAVERGTRRQPLAVRI